MIQQRIRIQACQQTNRQLFCEALTTVLMVPDVSMPARSASWKGVNRVIFVRERGDQVMKEIQFRNRFQTTIVSIMLSQHIFSSFSTVTTEMRQSAATPLMQAALAQSRCNIAGAALHPRYGLVTNALYVSSVPIASGHPKYQQETHRP